MHTVIYDLTDILQPTETSCGYTALSMLLSHYKKSFTVETLLQEVPQPLHENGEPSGSVTAQLVSWCLQNGMKTKM